MVLILPNPREHGLVIGAPRPQERGAVGHDADVRACLWSIAEHVGLGVAGVVALAPVPMVSEPPRMQQLVRCPCADVGVGRAGGHPYHGLPGGTELLNPHLRAFGGDDIDVGWCTPRNLHQPLAVLGIPKHDIPLSKLLGARALSEEGRCGPRLGASNGVASIDEVVSLCGGYPDEADDDHGWENEPRPLHADAPSSRGSTSCDSRVAAISQYFSSISMPIARRPKSLAARSVEPLPMNGSRMTIGSGT